MHGDFLHKGQTVDVDGPNTTQSLPMGHPSRRIGVDLTPDAGRLTGRGSLSLSLRHDVFPTRRRSYVTSLLYDVVVDPIEALCNSLLPAATLAVTLRGVHIGLPSFVFLPVRSKLVEAAPETNG